MKARIKFNSAQACFINDAASERSIKGKNSQLSIASSKIERRKKINHKETVKMLENLEGKIEQTMCQEPKCRNGLRSCDHSSKLMITDHLNPHKIDDEIALLGSMTRNMFNQLDT